MKYIIILLFITGECYGQSMGGGFPSAQTRFSGIGIPVYAQVTGSNATTTGQALTDITGLSVTLAINATYEFEVVVSASTSAVTTGTAYGVQYSAAGASVEANISGSSTSTAMKCLRISAFNSAFTKRMFIGGLGQLLLDVM